MGLVDEAGKRHPAQVGVPQGAVISPLLANIYLHYVFDLWSHQWRQKRAKKDVTIVRFADDAVLCFQHKAEANEYLVLLNRRLQKFGLTLHTGKTRLLQFGRFAAKDRAKCGQVKPETFDFLGFTHYCAVTQNGGFKVGRKTSKKRVTKQIKAVECELRRRMHEPVGEILKWLQSVVRGHLNYYAVPGNSRRLSLFHYEVVRRWFKVLRRRSQRHKIIWEKFGPWARDRLPKVRIVHPYPEERFSAKHSR